MYLINFTKNGIHTATTRLLFFNVVKSNDTFILFFSYSPIQPPGRDLNQSSGTNRALMCLLANRRGALTIVQELFLK